MAFHPSDWVEPVATDDPSTRLRTGDRIHKLPEDPTSSHTDPAPGPPTPTTGNDTLIWPRLGLL